MLEPGSFDTHINGTVLIIMILGHSKIDIEISDIGMKPMESNDCREVSEADED